MIRKICEWYLVKYYPVKMTEINVDTKNISYKFAGYAKRGQWSHVVTTVECWVYPQKDTLFDKVAIYKGGQLDREYTFKTPELKFVKK